MFAFFPAKGIQAICHPSPHGLCGILMLRKRLAVAATWMGKSITCALCALRNLEPRASLAHGFPAVCRGLWFELVCDGRRGDLSRHFFDSVCVLFRGGLSRPFFVSVSSGACGGPSNTQRRNLLGHMCLASRCSSKRHVPELPIRDPNRFREFPLRAHCVRHRAT